MRIIASPGIFEVDLVFPRNATYTPQALTPIVWALQNPSSNQGSPGSVSDGLIELNEQMTSNELFLVSDFVNTIAYPNGHWTLLWTLEFYNCSQLSGNPTVYTRSDPTVFTISNSGQEPDLLAATSADECGTMEAYAFNVTSFGEACGYLGPTPTTNPCAVTINSTATSSLYAAATASACSPWSRNANVTCPSVTSANKTAGQSRMATVPVLLMLLATVTNLIHLG
ncbi:hypothetical protein N7520_003600 [Penicillium odoratum]|uniref:uncharacterized protein n=1 Tax=Penicillium odoratum TaxID=1167516 RepID=UPI0025491FAF|nr:uncharacterized protein N7520_003600 [Penicillium odoratum]KAJ5769041.1 hypothetical protein N7520_003600 [Penicillium odoratum]